MHSAFNAINPATAAEAAAAEAPPPPAASLTLTAGGRGGNVRWHLLLSCTNCLAVAKMCSACNAPVQVCVTWSPDTAKHFAGNCQFASVEHARRGGNGKGRDGKG